MNENVLSINGRLTSTLFEGKFLKDLEDLQNRLTSEDRVFIDLSNLSWIDLLEGMCLPVVADWIERSFRCRRPAFRIYTPEILLKKDFFRETLGIPAKDARIALDKRRARAGFNNRRESVFHRALWDWRLLRYIQTKDIDLFLTLENQQYRWNDRLFMDRSVSKSRREPERVIDVTSILARESLLPVAERLAEALIKSIPRLQEQEVLHFCHLIYRLCENVFEHAYAADDGMPKTGAIAVRYIRPGGLIKSVEKYGTPLKAFQRLAIPERLHSFYEEYYASPIVEIAVVDGGIGVYEKLKENYREKHEGMEENPFKVLQYAFQKGSTSKRLESSLTEEDIGLGLFRVKKQALAWDGIIEMRSCQSRIIFSKDCEKGVPPDPEDESKEIKYFPGTQVRVLIPEISLAYEEQQEEEQEAVEQGPQQLKMFE